MHHSGLNCRDGHEDYTTTSTATSTSTFTTTSTSTPTTISTTTSTTTSTNTSTTISTSKNSSAFTYTSTSTSMSTAVSMMSPPRFNTFVQVLNDYMVQTSLHGYRYLAEPGRHWFERLMWTIVHIASTSCLLIIVHGMYVEYYNQLPVTTIKSIHHPIKDVPYPGIAFCDINKLRKSKTLELASKLYNEYNNISVTEERLGELLRYLGLLYDQSEQINSESASRDLDEVLRDANITLNITEVMQGLSTPCEELLVKCKWESQEKPCKEMFKSRKTMEGFCCTFNYVRPTDDFNPQALQERPEPEASPTAGPHMGLTVLVQSNLSDYYYPSIPVIGLKVLIFNPHDYPDTGSGGLTELLVTMKEEVFFSLSAVTTQATELVHDLQLDRRSCYFNSDIKEKFGDLYSYSDCMMDCRIDSIRETCACLPFYSPSREETPVCGIQNVDCLLRNRDSWQTMRPLTPTGKDSKFEGKTCDYPCYPSCTSTLYTVSASSMPLSQQLMAASGNYPTVNVDNHSIVHIYFGSPSTPLMTSDVLTTWFELLSNIGGVCGVFVGFSLMSIIEFIYFFTVRLAFEALDRHRQQGALHLPEGQQRESGGRRLEIGHGVPKPRAKYGWTDMYPKKSDLPEDKDNGFQPRLGRSANVRIFWNEISTLRDSKRGMHDVVF